MLSGDQKQRLLDAVRDVGIDELPEAAAFLIARGEVEQLTASAEKPPFTVWVQGAEVPVEADCLTTTPWGALVFWKTEVAVAVFAPGQWLCAGRKRKDEHWR